MTKTPGNISGIVKSATIIMVCTIIIKLLGFLREFALSYFWGTSGISDAFLVSQTIPGTIFEFAGVGITTCYIPIYFKILQSDSFSGAKIFTDKITSLVLCFSTVIVTLVWAFTPECVRIFAKGFDDETMDLACGFTRVAILSLYFSSFTSIFRSYLQSHNNFTPNAIGEVVQAILVLLSIYLGAVYNIWLLVIGCALSIGVRVAILYPYTKSYGYRYSFNFNWKDDNVRYFGMLLLPVIVGVAVNDINTIVDKTIASTVAVGAISALTYGNSLMQLANGGVVQPIATVCYPFITKYISEGKTMEAADMLKQTVSIVLVLFIPLTALFCLYCEPITELLFGRGAFNNDSIAMTSSAFFYYSIGLSFVAIRELLSRYYYACGNTKTPMINAAIGVVFNIIFNIVLSRFMGVGGLALATSISALVTSVLLIYDAKGKVKLRLIDIFDMPDIGKSVIASIFMAALSIFIYHSLESSLIIKLAIVFSVSLVSFGCFAIAFKIQNFKRFLNLIHSKIKK